ncbi:MAG: NusG domain II-containing protein [Lachnospiraceae bacterium]|nr:NusG domain II-containing protein [Lachnospiraceae bacterium]
MKRSMRDYISKRDLFLILFLLVLSCLFLLAFQIYHTMHKARGGAVEITVDGKIFGTYPLEKDQVIPITNKKGVVSNTLTIKDGKAYMSHANCPDRLCMHQGRIDSDGQSIVCLPNKIVCTVHSDTKPDMDVMTQ